MVNKNEKCSEHDNDNENKNNQINEVYDGICDTMQLLVESGNIGAVSTDENRNYWYCLVRFE